MKHIRLLHSQKTLEERQAVCREQTSKENAKNPKGPGVVCVVLDSVDDDPTNPESKIHRFLIPRDYAMNKFLFKFIRPNLFRKTASGDVRPFMKDEALFLFLGLEHKAMNSDMEAQMGAIHDQHKSEDGFLYILYKVESAFGGGEEEI